jgi:hypothetical protein
VITEEGQIMSKLNRRLMLIGAAALPATALPAIASLDRSLRVIRMTNGSDRAHVNAATPQIGDAIVFDGTNWGRFSILGMPLRFERYRMKHNNDDDAFAAMLKDAVDREWRTCRMQFGAPITLSRQPPPLYRVHLEGDDLFGATITQAYNGRALFQFAGPPGYSGGGLHNFSIGHGADYSGGTFIVSENRSGFEPDGLILENLYMGGYGGRPIRCIHLIGNRAKPSGMRGLRLDNVTCFGAQGGNVYLRSLVLANVRGLNVYRAGGDGDVYCLGVPFGLMAEDINASACDIEGTLRLDYIRSAEFQGSFASVHWGKRTCSYTSIRSTRPVDQDGIKGNSCTLSVAGLPATSPSRLRKRR